MRLIATDYDGTLNHGGIDEAKIDAIRRWRAAGHKFGIISGRGPDFLPRLQEELGENFDFLASCNGGIATDSEGNELFHHRCTDVDVTAFVDDLLAWGAHTLYINYDDQCILLGTAECREPYDFIPPEQRPSITSFDKMALFFATPEEAETMAANIRAKRISFLLAFMLLFFILPNASSAAEIKQGKPAPKLVVRGYCPRWGGQGQRYSGIVRPLRCGGAGCHRRGGQPQRYGHDRGI